MAKKWFTAISAGIALIPAVVLAFTLLIAVFNPLFFFSLVVAGDDRAKPAEIREFVLENETALRQAIEDGDVSSFNDCGIVKKAAIKEDHVDFFCGGAGLAPSGTYVGFFYSPEDDMTAVWCAPHKGQALTPKDGGFQWKEEHGDNRYYVEKICDNFYYYRASF